MRKIKSLALIALTSFAIAACRDVYKRQALGKANITVNKNSVPNDPQKPFVTSGIRVGTPAVTRRGFNEQDCRELAGWMCDVLDALGKENEEQVIAATKEKVLAICKRLPVYA